MKKFSGSHHGTLNELNITPLLDLVFVLLVIFIITTPQLSNDLELNLPTPTPPRTTNSRPPKLNYLIVGKDGTLSFNSETVTLESLKPLLIQKKAQDKNVNVVLKGAADADYENVVGVLDLIQQVDITNVGLATEISE